jgi:pectate lyase
LNSKAIRNHPREDRDARRLKAVLVFAKNILTEAADIYHSEPTPLLANGIHVLTRQPLEWVLPDGRKAVISNLATQQNLMRVLAALSRLTGEPKYMERAKANFRYYFDNLHDQNGLLYWGGHSFVDLQSGEVVAPGPNQSTHELKNVLPYYELMREVDAAATARFIRAFWNAHVYDWSRLEIGRHGQYSQAPGALWESPFASPEPFIKTRGLSFLNAGNDLIYSGAFLYMLTGESGALEWSKRLAAQYVKARHPQTGLGVYQFTQPLQRETTTDDNETDSKYGDRAQRQFGPEFGPGALEGNLLIERHIRMVYVNNPLIELELAARLGAEGAEFREWTREGLVAFRNYGYNPETNLIRPLLADGTDLSHYIIRRNGFFGKAGEVLQPFTADGRFLLTYLRAFAATQAVEFWETARAMAAANGLGEIGVAPGEGVQINSAALCADPYALFAVLEIQKLSPADAYLELARIIGDNIIRERFHHGYFVPGPEYVYANPDAIEPFALLALEAVLRGAAGAVPPFVGGSGYIHGHYRFPDGRVRMISDGQFFEAKLK